MFPFSPFIHLDIYCFEGAVSTKNNGHFYLITLIQQSLSFILLRIKQESMDIYTDCTNRFFSDQQELLSKYMKT